MQAILKETANAAAIITIRLFMSSDYTHANGPAKNIVILTRRPHTNASPAFA
jgi:hypothetical protein